MSSLTRQSSIEELRISCVTREVLGRNGTTQIGQLADLTRSELEAAGIPTADINQLNDELEEHGFNPVF